MGGEGETSWNRKLQVEKTSILKEFCLINKKHETEFYNEVWQETDIELKVI